MCTTHVNWLSGDRICEDKSDKNHTAGPGCPLSVLQGAPLVGAARGVWRGARRKSPGPGCSTWGAGEGTGVWLSSSRLWAKWEWVGKRAEIWAGSQRTELCRERNAEGGVGGSFVREKRCLTPSSTPSKGLQNRTSSPITQQLSKMQILWLRPGPVESETLWVDSAHLRFNKPSGGFWLTVKFGNRLQDNPVPPSTSFCCSVSALGLRRGESPHVKS